MLQTSARGGVAGAVATVAMTVEQPLDKRLFNSGYDGALDDHGAQLA